mgnify:FL=1
MTITLENQFSAFSKPLLQAIEKNAIFKTFQSGEVLMRRGQYVKNTVLVLNGSIKIYREDDDGGEYFMYYLLPGQACAISMICATKNQTSQIMAKVVEDTDVVMVPLALMDQWMMEHRTWYEFVIDTYRNRFEEVLDVVDNIAFKAMDERLEFYLKRQRATMGGNELKISHQDIADDLHTSREVISRLLKKLEHRGDLVLNRNQIIFRT